MTCPDRSGGHVTLHATLLLVLFVLPLDLQAQPDYPQRAGLTVQNPKRQMVMITPAMLQQPEDYTIHLPAAASPPRVVVSLYHHTGIKVSERTVDLPATTDRLAFDTIIDGAMLLPIGYYHYQIDSDTPQPGLVQADTLRFRDVSATHLPADTSFGGYAEFADVDGDSTLDIITGINEAISFHQPRLLINDGSGRFTDQSAQRFPPINLIVNDLAVFDVELDGDLDIFFAAVDEQTGVESTDRLYLNDGEGNFTDVSSTYLPTLPSISVNVDWGLINDDSFPDLVVSSFALFEIAATIETPLSVLINDGTGRFVDQTDQYLPESLYGVRDVALADVNRDMRNDIVLANQDFDLTDAQNNVLASFSGRTGVFIQTDEDQFVDETAARLPEVINPSKLVQVTDINNDDAPDVYVINLGGFIGSGVLQELYLNDGAGSFAEVTAEQLPQQFLTNINDVDFQDFDNDGDVDMYIVNTVLGGGSRDVLSVNVDGFFSDASESLPLIEDFGISAASGDVDGDGDYDVFVSNADGTAGFGGLDKLLENISPTATAIEPPPARSPGHVLFQNHPNPFTSSTQIAYTLSRPGFVTMRLFDVRGRAVRTLVQAFQHAGSYFIDVEAERLPSGLYFYRLDVDNAMVETKKMVRIR